MARAGGNVVAVDVAEGRRRDSKLAAPAPAEAAVGRVDAVPGDEGSDADAVRGVTLDELDAPPVIPDKLSRVGPWPRGDEMRETSKDRNRAERRSGKAEPFRGFATRYDKLREVCLGLVRLIFGFIRVRQLVKAVNRP